MRTISFVVVGGVGGEFPTRGTVVDLLLKIPYLLNARIVPPLHVINDLLAKGGHSAGMSGGCHWVPFQMTPSEWENLVQHLASLPDDDACETVQPPDWVHTVEDWQTWIMIHKYGFPESFRAAEREVRDLENARGNAQREGDQELVLELHLRVIEASERLAHLALTNRENKEQ